MFRTVGDQASLLEAVLPPELLRLPAELERVDALLDDAAFFEPFVEFFDPRMGRPSTPMETYLRLMFLKFRYRLGYEALCQEVSDSIAWRRFCRIPLEGSVPHPLGVRDPRPTTLMKLTTRCGAGAVAGLNETLLAKATEAKLLRTSKLGADTTVVPSNVSYPSDSGLLAKAVRRIASTGKRIQAAGGATRTTVRDRSRAAGKRAHTIGAKLRSRSAAGRDEALSAVRRTTGELADLAETAATEAERLLGNAKQALRRARANAKAQQASGEHDADAGRRRGRLARAVNDLTELLGATRQIAETRQRLAGQTPDGSTRRVSLHDPDARPIAKGRLGLDRVAERDHQGRVAAPARHRRPGHPARRAGHHPGRIKLGQAPPGDRLRHPERRTRRTRRGDPPGPPRRHATGPATPPCPPPRRARESTHPRTPRCWVIDRGSRTLTQTHLRRTMARRSLCSHAHAVS